MSKQSRTTRSYCRGDILVAYALGALSALQFAPFFSWWNPSDSITVAQHQPISEALPCPICNCSTNSTILPNRCNHTEQDDSSNNSIPMIADSTPETTLGTTTKWQLAPTLEGMASGAARTNKIKLASMIKMGIPFEKEGDGDDALIFYSQDAWPQRHLDYMERTGRPIEMNASAGLPLLTPSDAVENCDYLNVAVIQRPQERQCLAVLSHHEDASFHIQSYRRMHGEGPLVAVGKGINGEGHETHPIGFETKKHGQVMTTYWNNIDRVLREVKQVVDRVARNNTVAAILSNKGFSSMLANFACVAKKHGVDLGHVIVFATDPETEELATSFGMTAYYDEKMFSPFPSKGAECFGCKGFFKMIAAKAICIRMLSMLGYDFLFQDVDVMWYKDPIKYFTALDDDHDIYFMDDGAHWRFYAPYDANMGFFYARNNQVTKNLFSSFLNLADHIFGMNDQALMNRLLSIHAAGFGLRPKVFSRNNPHLFLGGYQFQYRPDIMRLILKGKVKPYAFHMHWTTEQEEKLSFLSQFGLWYLNANNTCSVEPVFQCFYRDLPSLHPCKDRPPYHDDRPSFW